MRMNALAAAGFAVMTTKDGGSGRRILTGPTKVSRYWQQPAAIEDVGAGRTITVIATDPTPDRAGDIVEPAGVQLASYRRNPVVLFNHDYAKPIAKCTDVSLKGNTIVARITFPPAGASPLSDEVFALIKAGVLTGWSIGFLPITAEPLDRANPKKGPQRFRQCELLEISAVAVPANPNAITIERGAHNQRQRRVLVLAKKAEAWGGAPKPLNQRQRQVEMARLRASAI